MGYDFYHKWLYYKYVNEFFLLTLIVACEWLYKYVNDDDDDDVDDDDDI